MRFVYWIIAVPVLAFVGAFAAANPEPVALRLWPFPYELQTPVYAAVLGAFLVGFLIAALWFWLAGVPVRLERRRLARHQRELETETRRLREELAAASRGRAPGDGTAPGVDSTARAAGTRRLIATGGD